MEFSSDEVRDAASLVLCRACDYSNGHVDVHAVGDAGVAYANLVVGPNVPRRERAIPGPCPNQLSGMADTVYTCSLRAGHDGLHEAAGGVAWTHGHRREDSDATEIAIWAAHALNVVSVARALLGKQQDPELEKIGGLRNGSRLWVELAEALGDLDKACPPSPSSGDPTKEGA